CRWTLVTRKRIAERRRVLAQANQGNAVGTYDGPSSEGGRPVGTVREKKAPSWDLRSRSNEVGTVFSERSARGLSSSRRRRGREHVCGIRGGDGGNSVTSLRSSRAKFIRGKQTMALCTNISYLQECVAGQLSLDCQVVLVLILGPHV